MYSLIGPAVAYPTTSLCNTKFLSITSLDEGFSDKYDAIDDLELRGSFVMTQRWFA